MAKTPAQQWPSSGGGDLWPHQLQIRLPSLAPSRQWPLLRRSWTSTEGIHREGTFSFSASIWSWVESPDVWSFVCRNHHEEFLHSVTCNLYIHYHTHPVQKDWKNNRAIARPIERFQTSKAMTRPMWEAFLVWPPPPAGRFVHSSVPRYTFVWCEHGSATTFSNLILSACQLL